LSYANEHGTAVAVFIAVAGNRENKKWRWHMKFQQIIRGHMMLMGLGAALLLANSAYAQQDMDPAFFDDTPGTPQVQQAAVVPAGQEVQATGAMNADAATPVVAQDMLAPQWTPLDEIATIFLMVGIGSVVLLRRAKATHENRRRTFRDRAISGFPSGVTTN
jgi:hypothetical protein